MKLSKLFVFVVVFSLFFSMVQAATIIANPISGSAPLTVNFTGDSPLWFARYTWSFGDDTGAIGKNVVHTYFTPGTYQVDLVVFDYWGLGKPKQHARTFITVNAGTTGNVSIQTTPSPATGQTPLNVFFEAVSSFTNVVYQWDFGDGSIGFGRTITHTFTNNTNNTKTFHVTLFVKRNNNVVAIRTVTVTVNPTPQQTGSVTISTTPSNATINAGQTIFFTATTSNNGICGNFTYDWVFGDGATATGQSVSHQYNSIGTFNVTVTVFNNCQNNNSLFGSETKTVTVLSGLNTPQINLSFNPSNMQVPNTVTMTATGNTGNLTYNWLLGDGNTATTQTVVHTYYQPGTYTVTVTVSNGIETKTNSKTFTLQPVCLTELQATAKYTPNDPSNQNPDNYVGDSEMLQAIKWWYNAIIVPGTCNKIISTSDLFTIANYWINQLFVSQ